MTGLLRLLRQHAGAVEADLQRFYGIDYRDRWRRDGDGRRRLTLRRLFVLVRHLPESDSAVAAELRKHRPYWSLEAHLLDNVRMSLTGSDKKPAKPWPGRFDTGRPRSGWGDPKRVKKLTDARRRARQRRAAHKAAKEG
jgi:hypothetical protein